LVETKQHPITSRELHMPAFLVLMFPHCILGKNEAVFNFCQEDITVLELLIHSSNTGGTRSI